MTYLLASVFSFSLDTFLACLGVGFFLKSWRQRLGLAVAFGACDGMAAGLGLRVDYHLPEPLTVTIYLLAAFMLGRAARSRSALLFALPVLFSIDNLFGGAPATLAPALGVGSALMAMLGLTLSLMVRQALVPSAAEV